MQLLIHLFGIILSLVTTSGVVVHDLRIDKVTSAARTAPVKVKVKGGFSSSDIGASLDPHTHPRHASHTLRGFAYRTPNFPPRDQRIKKYLQQNIEPRGRHAFDNYSLPIIS